MRKFFAAMAILVALVIVAGCERGRVESISGTMMATAGNVKTNQNGLTVEQQNIKDRIHMDNQPGAIKHLYVISAYSGQVVIYSTVRGKVTSSGKRLTPSEASNTRSGGRYSFAFPISGRTYYTNQVLAEDGTYGHSAEYLYWWDAKGVYHQHYVSGGQILHISDQPLAVKGIIINMEVSQKK